MAVKGNMHIATKVVEVPDFHSEVRFDLQGRLEAAMASKGIKWLFEAICTLIPG